MKSATQLLLFVLTLIGSISFANAMEDCGGCAELKIIGDQLKPMKEMDERATKWVIEGTKALKRLPTEKGRKLSFQQIQAVTQLLASAKGNDPDFAIIDGNLKLFKANESGFLAAFEKVANKDTAQYLKIGLNVKMGELEEGQRK